MPEHADPLSLACPVPDEVDDLSAYGEEERVPVKSFFEGQDYLQRLVRIQCGAVSNRVQTPAQGPRVLDPAQVAKTKGGV